MRRTLRQSIFKTEADVQNAASRFEGIEELADLQEVAQVAPFDEFHREIVKPAFGGDFEDRHHIRVHKFLTDASFPLEGGYGAGIVCPALTQQLQGDNLAGLDIFCAKDAGKTAGGIAVQQFVSPQDQTFGLAFQDSAALQ